VGVALTSDKLLTVETKSRSLWGKPGPDEVVLHDLANPCAPPLLRLEFSATESSFVPICRLGIAKDLKTYFAYSDDTSQEQTSQQEFTDDHQGIIMSVIDGVQHPEHDSPPAKICASEAAELTRAQWESTIENWNLHTECSSFAAPPGTLACLLTFNRHPRCFDTTLLRSKLGEQVIATGAEVQPKWANGAKILVPGLVEEVWQASNMEIELSTYHVVARPGDVDSIMASLKDIPYKDRPRLKHGVPVPRVADPAYTELFQDMSCDDDSKVASKSDLDSLDLFENPDAGSTQEQFSSSSSDTFNEYAREAWLSELARVAKEVQIVHLNMRDTFIDIEESPVVTPRTTYSCSAPEITPYSSSSFELRNPRIWSQHS